MSEDHEGLVAEGVSKVSGEMRVSRAEINRIFPLVAHDERKVRCARKGQVPVTEDKKKKNQSRKLMMIPAER